MLHGRRLLPAFLALAALPGLAACDEVSSWFGKSDAETAQEQAAPGSPRSFAQRPSPAQRLDEAGITKAFMVEAPQTGVDLGWGWSVDREQPIPTHCIEFARDKHAAQETNVSISEVRDSQELSKSMNVSSSVSVKAVGYEASGKAAFAKNTKISSYSMTYVVRADVRNGAEYVSPRAAAHGHIGAAVSLTDAAASLARRDLGDFQAACGEGFVSARMTGAEAYAVIDIRTKSRSDRQSLKTKVSGSGWGVKVDAAFAASSESGREQGSTSITFYQAGGSGEALPSNKEEIIARIKALATAAQDAGKIYTLEVTPYQVLENFPRDAELTADAGEVDEIAAAWALHRTVYDDIGTIFADPADYEIPVADCSGKSLPSQCTVAFVTVDEKPLTVAGGDDKPADVDGKVTPLDLLGIYQDIALMALDRVELGAQDCLAADENCAFDPTVLRSSYAVRTGLPLPKGWLDGTPTAAQRFAAHTAFHLRDAARGRCTISSLEAGCIANAEIKGWEARTGFVPLAATDQVAFDRAVAALDGAPWLRGDPDRPDALILWVPVAKLRAVEAALDGTKLAAR